MVSGSIRQPRDRPIPIPLRLHEKTRGVEGSALGIVRTHISRAGFNKERTRALLYVADVESRPISLAGYFVTLEKKGNEWVIAGSEMAAGY